MKKIYIKLAASVLSIVIALTMTVGATYAWLTLSSSPAVNGISIAIGGGNTIMLAPDIVKTVTDENGKQVLIHYPGVFRNTLNFSEYETYDYLANVAGLSPVSTADGIYWLLPVYEEETGALKDVSEFVVDKTLSNANIEKAENGSYIYLDFWMVSPGSEYDIRVSTDTRNNKGSYLIELPGVEELEDGSLQLAETQGIIESIARVGFLVNTNTTSTESMNAYVESGNYNAQYKSLQGIYPEKGQETKEEYQFTIYEPNATKHPSESIGDGAYLITKPLCFNPYGNTTMEEDISGRLMVQGANTWHSLDDGSQFEQIFQAAIANKENLTANAAADLFYNEYLQGQIAAYVKSGDFYKRTADLYDAAVDGRVPSESMKIQTAGATDDVMITTLSANTPQRVRMYIWLEGQDADCSNSSSVNASGFSLNIELSGANQ